MEYLYCGNSMTGVFRNGDRLTGTPVPFAELRRGDIVLFFPQGREQPGIVHRIIRRTAGKITTMGDNNRAPDARRLLPEDAPLRVTAALRWQGTAFRVHNGRSGMFQFRLNRIRYWLRRISGAARRRLPL